MMIMCKWLPLAVRWWLLLGVLLSKYTSDEYACTHKINWNANAHWNLKENKSWCFVRFNWMRDFLHMILFQLSEILWLEGNKSDMHNIYIMIHSIQCNQLAVYRCAANSFSLARDNNLKLELQTNLKIVYDERVSFVWSVISFKFMHIFGLYRRYTISHLISDISHPIVVSIVESRFGSSLCVYAVFFFKLSQDWDDLGRSQLYSKIIQWRIHRFRPRCV